MAKGKKGGTRRSSGRTFALSGALPLLNAVRVAIFGGGRSSSGSRTWASFRQNRNAGGTGFALKYAGDAAAQTLTGADPNIRGDSARIPYDVGNTLASGAMAVVGPVAGRVASKTGVNRSILAVQRMLGLKSRIKI